MEAQNKTFSFHTLLIKQLYLLRKYVCLDSEVIRAQHYNDSILATDCIAETGKIFPVSGGHICEGFVFRKVFKHENISTSLYLPSYVRTATVGQIT